MRLSNERLQKCWVLIAVGLVIVALAACAVADKGQHGAGSLVHRTGTADGATDTRGGLQAGTNDSLGGRANYEGSASGEYASGGLTAALRYFSATVSLIADFGDSSIWGIVTDGRDTITHQQIFRDLRLEPAAISGDDTDSFADGVTGVVDGNLFTGTWSGRFDGDATSSAGSRSAVSGTFQARRIDGLNETLTGTFSGDQRGYTNRTVGTLNDLSPTMRSKLAYGIARTARRDAVFTADVDSTAGGTVWNSGVTQSSDNPANTEDPVVVNWALNARYEGDHLVFDRTNLLSSSAVTLTTSGQVDAPGYRGAVALTGRLAWTGLEQLQVDASKLWNYSILVSDIEDSDDADYMAGGFWASLPDLDNPADPGRPSFTAVAGGNDPFHGANIEALRGRATYQGDAFGLYASRYATPAFRYFNAQVRLNADFNDNDVHGVVVDGRDTATDELLFTGLELREADIRTAGAASFASYVTGVMNGRSVYGDWGGQFLGNGVSASAVPGSVAGTFGVRSYDSSESLVGIFGVHEDLTRLLSGHGLGAGTVAVEPGDSEEHGNLVMSCPADGLACALTVRADGTASYDRNGGEPGFVFKLPHAPTVELDGVRHVGAGVAPPADGLTAGGTRHGVSVSTGRVQDGVGADQVVAFLREHVSKSSPGLETFSVRPVVRVSQGTGAEFIEYTERAVQLINTALPYEKRVLFSTNPAPPFTVIDDVPDDQVFVDVTPWQDWNDPDRGSGGERRNSRRDWHYDDEARRWEVQERRGSHIWIDSENMRRARVWNPDTREWERTVLESRVDDNDTVGKYRSDDAVVRTIARTLLQGLGLVTAVDAAAFPDSLLNLTDTRRRTVQLPRGGSFSFNERVYVPGHILYPLDREALLAAYGRLQPGTLPEDLSAESLGTWEDTSFHIRGSLSGAGGQVSFGVASRNGLAQPWASGSEPSSNLADSSALSGTVAWDGTLLGIARSGETVAGASRLAVDLATLDGQLDFTNLEQWSAGAAPGAAGTGATWGDGDLGYTIRVDGNRFTETGGDHGEVTGAFFGTSHRAAGGVVERNDLAASFGGKR